MEEGGDSGGVKYGIENIHLLKNGFIVKGNNSGIYSDWIMPDKDIEGLTPTEIASKYSLPSVPTDICDVIVPIGTRLEVSCANPILLGFPDGGGGIQYEIIGDFDVNWFTNARRLN